MQTLIDLTSLSSPPKLTDSKALTADMSVLDNLSPVELKAIAILSMLDTLALSFGKPNYTANHGQLIQDATSFMGGISLLDDTGANKQFWTILTILAWYSSIGTPYDVETLLAQSRDFAALPEETLNRIFFYLMYALSI